MSDPRTRHILLQQDNQAVVNIVNAMVSTSKPMMVELHKLQKTLQALGLQLCSRWIQSPVNRFADRLSQTLHPVDSRVYWRLLHSIKEEYILEEPAFC